MKLKHTGLILITYFLSATPTIFATQSCFILYDQKSRKTLKQEGNICDLRVSPCSTFKIALSLIGYNSGILKTTNTPVWYYRSDYLATLPSWKRSHNPTTWIKNSCVWYSQVLTQKLGLQKLKGYLKILNYGNQDFSGGSGKNNLLTAAWLSSSLKISANEQVSFLQKFLEKEFPLSNHAYILTKQILFAENLKNGWKLYGKAGMGFQQKADGSLDTNQQIAWFTGWATKDNRIVVIVKNVIDKGITGSQIKEQIVEQLH